MIAIIGLIVVVRRGKKPDGSPADGLTFMNASATTPRPSTVVTGQDNPEYFDMQQRHDGEPSIDALQQDILLSTYDNPGDRQAAAEYSYAIGTRGPRANSSQVSHIAPAPQEYDYASRNDDQWSNVYEEAAHVQAASRGIVPPGNQSQQSRVPNTNANHPDQQTTVDRNYTSMGRGTNTANSRGISERTSTNSSMADQRYHRTSHSSIAQPADTVPAPPGLYYDHLASNGDQHNNAYDQAVHPTSRTSTLPNYDSPASQAEQTRSGSQAAHNYQNPVASRRTRSQRSEDNMYVESDRHTGPGLRSQPR